MDSEEERSTRVVDSRYSYRPLFSFGARLFLMIGLVLALAVGILSWILGLSLVSVFKPRIAGVFDMLGGWSWLWITLLVIVAIGAAIGLLGKLGLVRVVSDLIDIAIRVDQQRLARRRLNPDAKTGKYPVPMELAVEYPHLLVSGNPAAAPQLPVALPSRRARGGATNVSEEQQAVQQQAVLQLMQLAGLLPQGVLPQLQLGASPLQIAGPSSQQVAGSSASSPAAGGLREEDKTRIDALIDEMHQGSFLESQYVKKVLPGRYDFREELQVFKPSIEGLFLGRSADGPMLMPIGQIWHLVTAGPTGIGKSKIMRLLFSQLIALNMECYLCDPHYAPVSREESGEEPLDWTPIEARLKYAPFRDPADIADFLRWLVEGRMAQRKELEYHGKPLGAPVFVALDELAVVTDERPESGMYIGKLLRQARKYRICLILSAQDLLVKSIGLDTGMMENIRTGYYGGGDFRTAKIALGLKDGEKVDEQGLGSGVVYLKTLKHSATRTRVPWPSNEAVHTLCSLSTLPVRELKRDPLPDTEQVEVVYQPSGSQQPQPFSVIGGGRSVEPGRLGRAQDPLKLEWIEEAGRVRLSDDRLAVHLNVTKYMANRYNNAAGWRKQGNEGEIQDGEMEEEQRRASR